MLYLLINKENNEIRFIRLNSDSGAFLLKFSGRRKFKIKFRHLGM